MAFNDSLFCIASASFKAVKVYLSSGKSLSLVDFEVPVSTEHERIIASTSVRIHCLPAGDLPFKELYDSHPVLTGDIQLSNPSAGEVPKLIPAQATAVPLTPDPIDFSAATPAAENVTKFSRQPYENRLAYLSVTTMNSNDCTFIPPFYYGCKCSKSTYKKGGHFFEIYEQKILDTQE